jgi:hypothetical protein
MEDLKSRVADRKKLNDINGPFCCKKCSATRPQQVCCALVAVCCRPDFVVLQTCCALLRTLAQHAQQTSIGLLRGALGPVALSILLLFERSTIFTLAPQEGLPHVR